MLNFSLCGPPSFRNTFIPRNIIQLYFPLMHPNAVQTSVKCALKMAKPDLFSPTWLLSANNKNVSQQQVGCSQSQLTSLGKTVLG